MITKWGALLAGIAWLALFAFNWCSCGSIWCGLPWGNQEPPNPQFSLSASSLLAEYKRNEVRADAMYKGQFVKVKGTVRRIEGGGIFSDAYASFDFYTGGFTPDSVKASFSDENSLAYINPGSSVSLICKVDGQSDDIFGSTVTINLKDCSISNDGTTP